MIVRFLFLCAVLPAVVRAQHPPAALSAGVATVFNDGRDAFALPIGNITREHRRAFSVGNSFFNENWIIAPASAAARDGLGPLFHTRSCSACHTKDGRGAPPQEGETMTGLLLRLSVPGPAPDHPPVPDPVYGDQLQVRAIPGAEPEADAAVRWIESKAALAGGEEVTLRKPSFTLTNWRYGPPGDGLMLSPRLAPPVIGNGLLEAVPIASLTALADPDDKNGDGISGRVNMVHEHGKKEPVPGRFGWKANQPSISQQVAGAFNGDIGLTTSTVANENHSAAQADKLKAFASGGTPEISDQIFGRVVSYIQTLGVPARRHVDDPIVLRGEKLFAGAKCAACHVTELRTGDDHPISELRALTIHPYTDLLLHDMGDDLADGRPDFLATGSEWRTSPLWGLGLNKAVNGNTFFLHDGRARTLTEAILWHAGEAAPSRDAFKAMSADDRAALIRFLESL